MFSANQSVTISGTNTGIIVSQSKPSDTTSAWLQLDSFGRPVRLYFFAQGAWLSIHPELPGMAKIWMGGSVPDFTTFDGGDAQALSAISGPMWQEILRAQIPIGEGTLPSGTVLTPGATGGEEKHTITQAELPAIDFYQNPFVGSPLNGSFFPGGAPDLGQIKPLPTKGTLGNGVAGNNLPPYLVVVYIQRTTRQYYAA